MVEQVVLLVVLLMLTVDLVAVEELILKTQAEDLVEDIQVEEPHIMVMVTLVVGVDLII